MAYRTVPKICPVCHGRGTVPGGFYPDSYTIAYVMCRTCDGRGYINGIEYFPDAWPRPDPSVPAPTDPPWKAKVWCNVTTAAGYGGLERAG